MANNKSSTSVSTGHHYTNKPHPNMLYTIQGICCMKLKDNTTETRCVLRDQANPSGKYQSITNSPLTFSIFSYFCHLYYRYFASCILFYTLYFKFSNSSIPHPHLALYIFFYQEGYNKSRLKLSFSKVQENREK